MFKKFLWFSLLILALFLSSCTPEIPATESPTVEIPIQTEAPTEPPEIVCARLISPEDGSYVPIKGKVTFAWEPVEGGGPD